MTQILVTFNDNMTLFSFVGQESIELQVGYKTLIQTHFKQNLPTPYQTELAIITIEEAIESIQTKLPNMHKIYTNDRQIHLIADYFDNKKQIDTTQIEILFNRLADVISGSPMQGITLFTSADFVAKLLILRELCHHLKIDIIEVI